ncbi:MAG: YbhB/YbcL family Raf kinase inhibitor-like protein [Candidatus Woesearchaeota archaeon]
MKLTSTAFKDNEDIPSKYTCDGENINPELKIENVPKNAESLVLIMDDPDIPDFVKEKFGIDVYDHWVVFNISPTTYLIGEDTEPSGIDGKNSSGKIGYTGPCPPDREHRYFFKLYALDIKLNLPEGSIKKEIEIAMKNHIIEKTELIGKYKRK